MSVNIDDEIEKPIKNYTSGSRTEFTGEQHLLEKGHGDGFQTVDQVREFVDEAIIEAIGDGLKLEIGKSRETRLNVCVESEFLVNSEDIKEGDTEAGEGKKLGEFKHRVDVALSWEGEDQNMRLHFSVLHQYPLLTMLPSISSSIVYTFSTSAVLGVKVKERK